MQPILLVEIMEQKSESEKNKENLDVRNGSDFDILRKDEEFWQRTVISLAKEEISEMIEEISENVSK